MCPQMHFGIAVSIPSAYNQEKLINVIEKLSNAHPFLKSLIGYEADSNQYYYSIQNQTQVQIHEREIAAEKDDFPISMWDDIKILASSDWNVLKNGLLSLYVYPGNYSFTVLFVAHHLLADGRGLLGISKEFADCYVHNIEPEYAPEHLIRSINDLPEGSNLPWISRTIINSANKKWRKENHFVSYDQYHDFANSFCAEHPIDYRTQCYKDEQLKSIRDYCHQNGITINDWLLAQMARETKAESIIIAFDIRDRIKNYVQGSLGNYASATGISFRNCSPNELELAKSAHKKVQSVIINNSALMQVLSCYMTMEPGLIDAAAISALGGFKSNAGLFVGQRMFGFFTGSKYSITNLGRLDCETITRAIFIPPASPAVKQTAGVLTVNGTMVICNSMR